jgi:hypothetical protein
VFAYSKRGHYCCTTLACLESLSIEEPEAHKWAMMAAINIHALLEYSQPQGVLQRADILALNFSIYINLVLLAM